MGIRFRVRDNGIGMSPEFLPHLYDPFSQERSEENITENLMDARILLVEDNEINIYVAQLILEKTDVWWRLQTVPIIAMTADAFEEEKKKTLEAGMNYHLSKPINPKTLYNILSNHLTGKRHRDQRYRTQRY